MNQNMITGAAIAAWLIASTAQAATITNNETTPQTVKLLSGDRQETITILPADTVTVDKLCPRDCSLVLQGGEEFEVGKNDELILEDGAVFSHPPTQGAVESEQPKKL